MTLPQRISRKTCEPKHKLRWPSHLLWVRRHACCVCGALPSKETPIEAAHVRAGYPAGTADWEKGGTGIKPADWWTVSLCQEHHREQHNQGAETFEQRHGVDLISLAQEFASKSPRAFEMKRERTKA